MDKIEESRETNPTYYIQQLFLLISADCLMSEWTPWCNGCSTTCGPGTETRSRRRLVLPWSSENKITCGHKTIACMTGYPDCSLGSICSDGSLILHIEGNGFECNHENQIQREPCNLPPCEKGKLLDFTPKRRSRSSFFFKLPYIIFLSKQKLSIWSKDNRIGHEYLTLIFSFNYV